MIDLPRPLYFGIAPQVLFGALHDRGAAGRLGMVVCNPFGFEEVCAHRALRHVAQAAARAGVPTLRFDYPGCGDSAGDESEAGLLSRWVASVHTAVEALKDETGVTEVCLLGVRLGAAIAALAAAGRDDVAALLAIAPVVRGRAYMRELALLEAASIAPGRPVDGLVESVGFVLDAETGSAIQQLDLRSLERRPAPRVVIVERDDVPGAREWQPALEALGAEVETVAWAGYAAMMIDPQRSQVPREIVDGVLARLAAWQGGAPARRAPGAAPGDAAATTVLAGPGPGGAVRETAVAVDAGAAALFGIVTEPVAAAAQRPGLLLLNSGSVHHIGPNRLWVRLAREWATLGITVLRLDLSGIGDSPARAGAQENVVYSGAAMRDIDAALAFLRRRTGGGPCHVLGLCSGAYHALKAATEGLAVASATMINPLTYAWTHGPDLSGIKDYEVVTLSEKYRALVFTAGPWLRLVRGQLDMHVILQVAARRLASAVTVPLAGIAARLGLTRGRDLGSQLVATTGRSVRLRFVFAAQAPGLELLRRDCARVLDRLVRQGKVSLELVPEADHTFTRLAARERLVALLTQRVAHEIAPRP